MGKRLGIKLFGLLLLGSCSVINLTPSKKIGHIEFSNETENQNYDFIYQNIENSPELGTLISVYGLDSVSNLGNSEFTRMLHLLNWTNSRWEHSGSNQPSKSTTLTILEEAKAGKKFRCVEYGIVLRSVLASSDFKARTVGLKTKDVEVTRVGAGHVLTEVWSDQHGKWFMADAQFNIVPVLGDIPLNAVEFQNAIIQGKDFRLIDVDGEVSAERKKQYMDFIPHYLYFFDYRFDQREIVYDSLYKVNDKTTLMLVPLGAKKPTVFQRKSDMDYLEYTHSLNDFYRKPSPLSE
jgi:hypothetical protein